MTKRLLSLAIVAALTIASQAPHAFGVLINVAAGYDLLATSAGTTLGTTTFQGVTIGSYNFGGTIGTKNTGDTDTIIQRLSTATSAGVPPASSSPISIQLDALQLESVAPYDPGTGLDYYFVTLQSVRGGPASTGSMSINFTTSSSGSFASVLDVFYDIRKGSLNGPIASSSDVTLGSAGTPWNRTAPSGALAALPLLRRRR